MREMSRTALDKMIPNCSDEQRSRLESLRILDESQTILDESKEAESAEF